MKDFFLFDKVRKGFFLLVVYLLVKAKEVFLNEFIESCFFGLMTMIGVKGEERMPGCTEAIQRGLAK